MKLFISSLLLLFSINCFANGWLSVPDFNLAKAGDSGARTYNTKGECQNKENQVCVKNQKDIRHWIVGSKPINILETFDCNDATDCTARLMGAEPEFSCSGFSIPLSDDKDNHPDLDFEALGRSAVGWFLWCQEEISLPHAQGKIDADLEDDAKQQEIENRDLKRVDRQAEALDCVDAVNAGGVIPNPDIQACLHALIKEVFEKLIPVIDL